VERFLNERLRLKVNQDKSSVGRFSAHSFLGFTVYRRNGIRVAVSRSSKRKLKDKIRSMTPRKTTYRPMKMVVEELNVVLRGWLGYYHLGASDGFLSDMDGYVRRRLRMRLWKSWKTIRMRKRQLKSLGMEDELAYMNANTRKGYWRVSGSPILTATLTNQRFVQLGLFSLRQRLKELRLVSRMNV
jgi:RNA-directed DNA polymerase